MRRRVFVKSTGYHPLAISYFSRVESAGGYFSDPQKEYYNAWFYAIDPIRSKIKEVHFFDGGFAGAFEKQIYVSTPAATNVNFVSGDYTDQYGFFGNGTTKAILSGFVPTDHGLTNLNQGYFVYRTKAGKLNVDGSMIDSDGMWFGSANGVVYGGYHTGTAGSITQWSVGSTLMNGYSDRLHGVVKNGSDIKAYVRGIEVNSTTGVGSSPTGEITWFRNGASNYGKVVHSGGIFTDGTMTQSDVQLLSDACDALFVGLGKINLTAPRFIKISDSTGLGQGATYSSSWANQINGWLSGELGTDVIDVNMSHGGGVLQSIAPAGGDTATSPEVNNLLLRWEEHIVPNVFDPANTYIAGSFGINDHRLDRNTNFSAANFQVELENVFNKLINEIGIPVANIRWASLGYCNPTSYATTVSPYSAGSEVKAEAYRDAARAACVIYGVKYADFYTDMRDNGGTANLADPVHPNSTGYTRMYNALAAATVPV